MSDDVKRKTVKIEKYTFEDFDTTGTFIQLGEKPAVTGVAFGVLDDPNPDDIVGVLEIRALDDADEAFAWHVSLDWAECEVLGGMLLAFAERQKKREAELLASKAMR